MGMPLPTTGGPQEMAEGSVSLHLRKLGLREFLGIRLFFSVGP